MWFTQTNASAHKATQEESHQCYYDHLYEDARGCDYGWRSKRNRPFRGVLKREHCHLILT